MDQAVFDHGAQYFTARDSAFVSLVNDWRECGIVAPWSTGFALSTGDFKEDSEPRFRAVKGMTGIAKHLAQGLEVRLSHKVISIEVYEGGWKINLENGEVILGRGLILTPPVPQSLQLLDSSGITLPEMARQALEEIKYTPCLALLAHLAGPSLVPEPGGLWFKGDPISWIADNAKKGITDVPGSLTIHAGPEYSLRNWATPEAEVISDLLDAATPWLGSKPIQTQLHRWRYSVPTTIYAERCLAIQVPAPLVFAGDAFGGPRMEGAALSGLAASQAVRDLLSHA
jgi:predicted NAD/FAD-dependent oxidoreductase